jgi:putative component of membrane protein insertase Oxa1/YidC/SpoIIIJ protein YidD
VQAETIAKRLEQEMIECTFQPAISPYTPQACHYSSNCSHHRNPSPQEKRSQLDDTTRAEASRTAADQG